MEQFKIIIVEDVALELKGTEGIIRNDIPEAQIIGTANNEFSYWKLIKQQLPDLVLLDLGLGGSTTVGVEICRQTKEMYPNVKWTCWMPGPTASSSKVANCSRGGMYSA